MLTAEQDEREDDREDELRRRAHGVQRGAAGEQADLAERAAAQAGRSRRRAHAAAFSRGGVSAGGGGAVAGAFEAAPGLREEDVVERRLVHREVRDGDVRGVERAHDVGELLAAGVQAHGDRAGARARRRARRTARARRAPRAQSSASRGMTSTVGLETCALSARGRALGDELAAVDDPDAVGEHVGLLEVLRREEDRRALLAGEARDLVPQRGARLDVEAGRRLVEEEDARVVQQREREVEAALHAAGVRRGLAVGGVDEADALEQLVAARRALGARDALQAALQAHVLAAGEHRVQRDVLQRDADRGAHLRALLRDVVARDGGACRRRRQQRREDLDRRRLARAVGPEEAVDLAGRDVQVDAVDGADAALELADEAR